jgi:1-acyl-sn-glycerol-3-phosphate acyltransferase
MKVARAFIFYLGIAAMALPTFLFIVLSWPLPLRWRWKIALLWAKFCRPWLRATVNLQFILEGREHLPPGPVIYICKHQSALETILLPGLLYPVVPVLKQELLWLPFLGWGLWLLSAIHLQRKAPQKALVVLKKHAGAMVAKGFSILIFPEGTRVPPGEQGTYRKGGIWLAKMLDIPIVPIALNTGLFWPRRSFIKNPGLAKAVIYPPLYPAEHTLRALQKQIEHTIESGTRALEQEALSMQFDKKSFLTIQ